MSGTILRHCSLAGCDELVPAGRCPQHAITTRNYGRPHRRASAHIMATATTCAVCGKPPADSDPLVRGHITAVADGGVHNPGNYRAEHRSCNARGGANIGNARRRN